MHHRITEHCIMALHVFQVRTIRINLTHFAWKMQFLNSKSSDYNLMTNVAQLHATPIGVQRIALVFLLIGVQIQWIPTMFMFIGAHVSRLSNVHKVILWSFESPEVAPEPIEKPLWWSIDTSKCIISPKQPTRFLLYEWMNKRWEKIFQFDGLFRRMVNNTMRFRFWFAYAQLLTWNSRV